jgi:aspartate/methionine/tyrosine aminotransferase
MELEPRGAPISPLIADLGSPPIPEAQGWLRRYDGGFGPIMGDPDLRAAYARHVSGLYGSPVDAEEVAITAGCNLAFFAAALLVARHGDSVLLPAPWYFNHQMTLAMLGIEARPLPAAPRPASCPTRGPRPG